MNCTRCKGTGFFRETAGVTHYGVPGLCYGCDGVGTKAAQDAKKQAAKDAAARELIWRDELLEAQKVEALALYDACEMGFISERKRDRRIASCITECVSAGLTREQFAAHLITDEVAVILACQKYNPEHRA